MEGGTAGMPRMVRKLTAGKTLDYLAFLLAAAALVTALDATTRLLSATSETCLAMAFMLSKAELAAAMALWMAAKAPSLPAGAALAAWSIRPAMRFWKSPN